MVTIANKNFVGVPVNEIPVADEYVRCNFMQPTVNLGPPVTGTRLFPGDDTPRIFRNCNMINCETPPGSTLDTCNTTLREYNVVHQVDETWVDDVLVASETIYKGIIHGKWNGAGYEYNGTPIEVVGG